MARAPAVILALAMGGLAAMLQGCGGGGGGGGGSTSTTTSTTTTGVNVTTNTTTTTTTTTPKTPPTPPMPPHEGPYCTTAECCKTNSTDPRDDQVCADFYNVDAGIAFTMLSTDTWQGKGGGFFGMDQAVFNAEPPTTRLDKGQQAMSLTHFQKPMAPYPGYGNAYGVVFPMGPSSSFWKFYQREATKGFLCGQCTDGFRCCPSCRLPIGDTMGREEFDRQKNVIVAATGTHDCGNAQANAYNEFDTNGLSVNDFAGVFYDLKGNTQAVTLSDSQLCTFLTKADKGANKARTQWPVWFYTFAKSGSSSLHLDHYISCGAATLVV